MRRTDFLCPLKIQRVKGDVSVPEMMKILPFGPLSGKFHLTKSSADNIIGLALRRSWRPQLVPAARKRSFSDRGGEA